MKTTTDIKIENLEVDIDIKEVFKTIFNYKWSIILSSVLALFITAIFLYFKTPHYLSQALIEVKSNTNQNMQQGDIIGSAFSNFGDKKVGKEIEILQTFHINNHALNKLNFQVQYFVYEGLKK
jgi:uncharacterized protein involved in exopolysaccharide biosynthesis